jgi:hypothetical protein
VDDDLESRGDSCLSAKEESRRTAWRARSLLSRTNLSSAARTPPIPSSAVPLRHKKQHAAPRRGRSSQAKEQRVEGRLQGAQQPERVGSSPRSNGKEAVPMRPLIAFVVAAAVALAMLPATAAAGSGTVIRVAPKQIDFGTRAVTDPPTDYYDGVKITNASGRTLDVIVADALPDDFGFGLMPGSTCPVFDTDPPMASGTSCRAVVRFSPSAFFVGWHQTGTLTITATEPATGELVTSVEVPISGTGKL